MKNQNTAKRYPLSLKGMSGGTGIQFFSGSSTDELKAQLTEMLTKFSEAKATLETEAGKFGTASEEAKSNYESLKQELKEMKEQFDKVVVNNNRVNEPGTMTPEQKAQKELESKAFYNFMRVGKGEMSAEERKALVADEDGQIIIPEELDKEIERELPKVAIFRQLVNIRKTNSDRIRKRSMNELTVGWGKLETSAKKASDFESSLKPNDRFIFVENLNGLTKIGVDELEDTDIQLQAYLGSSFALAAASEEDKAVLVGKGHSEEQPEGILTNVNVPRHTTAAVGTVTTDDLIDLFYKVPAQYRKNGTWVLPSYLEQTVRKFKNANGDYIWQAALTQGTPNQLLGRPVYTQDDFEAQAEGAEIGVFGDFKQGYTIVDKPGNSTIQRLNELYIEDDLIGFKYKKRVGGGVDKPNAFAILKVKKATA